MYIIHYFCKNYAGERKDILKGLDAAHRDDDRGGNLSYTSFRSVFQ